MPFEFRLTVSGADQVISRFADMVDDAKDLTPAWDKIEDEFTSYEENWFAGEGKGEWPQLSPSYAKWKERHKPGGSILVLEGDLKDSLLTPQINNKSATGFEFGTADPVAHYHQFGEGHNPVRKVIDVQEDEIDRWMMIVTDHLMGREL